MTAEDIIEQLGLKPHPEGGFYRETWRSPAEPGARSTGTAIYFLLRAEDHNHWHRIDATEIWHYYAGAPLALYIAEPDQLPVRALLGPELSAWHRPQREVPPFAWQRAQTLGAWTLVGCTVSPGFEFSRFELAPPGWEP